MIEFIEDYPDLEALMDKLSLMDYLIREMENHIEKATENDNESGFDDIYGKTEQSVHLMEEALDMLKQRLTSKGILS